MRDPASNARHIIDAVKAIDALAVGGTEAGVPAADRFQITIVLNSDDGGAPQTLHFDKSRTIDPHDVSPDDIDTTPWELLAAKKTDGDDGQGHL